MAIASSDLYREARMIAAPWYLAIFANMLNKHVVWLRKPRRHFFEVEIRCHRKALTDRPMSRTCMSSGKCVWSPRRTTSVDTTDIGM